MDKKYIESLQRLKRNPFYTLTAKQEKDLKDWEESKTGEFLDLDKISVNINLGMGVEEEKPKKQRTRKKSSKNIDEESK